MPWACFAKVYNSVYKHFTVALEMPRRASLWPRPKRGSRVRCKYCGTRNLAAGQRRRGPWGHWFCCRCHGRWRYRIRKCLQVNPELNALVAKFPYFLSFTSTQSIGIMPVDAARFEPVQFDLPRHKRRPYRHPVICELCDDVCLKLTRRGLECDTHFCNACGQRARRSYRRRLMLHDSLRKFVIKHRCAFKYLTATAKSWLLAQREPDVVDKILTF